MIFPMEFGSRLPDEVDTNDLTLVEDAITKVINAIGDDEIKLKPADFRQKGTIHKPALGGFDSAPGVSYHYTRAHDVVADTLAGFKKDLNAFRDACVDARKFVREADENAGANLLALQRQAANRLNQGSKAHHGDDAYSNSVNNPGADEPETDTETDTDEVQP